MNEGVDDPRLLSVAADIADGTAVEWQRVTIQVSDPDRAILDELRELERVKELADATPPCWGTFLIREEIGRGKFGRVFHAYDPHLQIDIALKIVRGDVSAPGLDVSRAFSEARFLAKVRHPNVVHVLRVERILDEVGIVMELVRGRTLDAIVRETGLLSACEATVIGMDVCRALAAMHAAGVLHGDVKAHNVMRGDGGRTVVMDLGAGRLLERDVKLASDFAGTPVYLPPEVFDGAERGVGSDIYSLGVLLYYLVTGTYPVEGSTRSEITRRHHQQTPRKKLRDVRPDLPDRFIRVVEQALAPAPVDRFQSVGALEQALADTLTSPDLKSNADTKPIHNPTSEQRPRPWPSRWKLASALAVVVVALAFGVWLMRPDAPSVITPSQSPVPPVVAGAYQIEAALYVDRDGTDVRVQQGSAVAPGDKLSLHVRTSMPAHIYVVNEDEQGEQYLLFPLPGQTLTNPLPAGELHRLPGVQNGERLSWQVTSAGGREHFLIFANTERLSAFEQMFASLAPAVRDTAVQSVRLSPEAVGVLRGVGGVTASPPPSGLTPRLARDFATPLLEGEETVRGVWIRQITLENPVR